MFTREFSGGLICATGILALHATPQIVRAETPSAESSSTEAFGDGTLEEVMVTAQRRSESLQRVPITVTVVTSNDLAKAGVAATSDLAVRVPGLTLTQNRTVVTPYLRGIGTQNSTAGEEGSIATYVDGVYVPSLSGANFAFNNIERVEVLKGPQGTLFGRNATGGLLHIITKEPSHTPALDGGIGYGSYDTWTASTYGTTGLSDRVAVDLAGFFTHQAEGWGRNLNIGGDVNLRDEWALRSKLLFAATDALTLRLALDYDKRDSDIGNSRGVWPGSVLIGGTTRFRGSIYDVQNGVPRRAHFEQWGVSLKADLEVGDATLTSTTAYRYSNNFGLLDQDGTPTKYVDAYFTELTRSAQQEFLLVGQRGSLDYTGGIFLFYSKAGVDPLGLRSVVLPVQNRDRIDRITTRSYAPFVQGTYHFTDATGVTAGLRFTRDEREIDGRDVATAGNPLGAPGVTLTSTHQEANFNKVTWRFAVDHEIRDDVLGYASYSRGFKSGVYNSANFLQAAAEPETLDAYEVGVKSDLFERKLRLNLAAFRYKYTDIQLFRVEGGITTIYNAAAGRTNGADLEAVWLPTVPLGRLQIDSAVSWLDGEYTSFPLATFTTPNPAGGNILSLGDAKGRSMIRTPDWTATLSADYSVPVSFGELGFNVSYYYSDGFYWDPDNRLLEPSYDLIGAALSWTSVGGAWRVSAFGRNLTDETYFGQTTTSNFGDQTSPGAPRTYGISFNRRFVGE